MVGLVGGRYYVLMQHCLYFKVAAECGPDAARRHVAYSIRLWEPPVIAFYCDDISIYLYFFFSFFMLSCRTNDSILTELGLGRELMGRVAKLKLQ